MLDCLRHSACHLTLLKCLPRCNIDINLLWLIEQTDQIRCKRCINRCLTANRCIGSRQKGGCIIDKRYAASISSCHKSCQIRHNASSDCNDRTIPAIAFLKHCILDTFLRLSGLAFLSCREHEQIHLISCCDQLLPDRLGIWIAHIRIRNKRKLLNITQKSTLKILYQLIHKIVADFDIVTVINHFFQFYVKYTHFVTYPFIGSFMPTASLARRSASSLPSTPECPLTFTK